MTPKKVLIIDDSALVRQVISTILSSDPGLEVVGAASDPLIAWEMIRTLHPDVLTLDVEMPRMDGLTFLDKLMRARPMPVLMISSLTEKGCETTLRALELGAVDFVAKPKIDVAKGTAELAGEILAKVKMAATAQVLRRSPSRAQSSRAEAKPPVSFLGKTTHQVIAVGASTGGTEALRIFLSALPADSPGTVIVQHMPENFTRNFAKRLDSCCRIRVSEAADGDRILPGHALLAPGNQHMEVRRSGAALSVRVFDAERVNCHRPSVDVLFHSCARELGSNVVGVILTGMGDDGARGLLKMREAGAHTIAQNEATCVVFGMPREAIKRGAAEQVLPLDRIAQGVVRATAAS